MREKFRAWVLDVVRVPAAPTPPPGDPSMVRTFRAAPRYFAYSIAAWALKQVSALIGLIFSYLFFREFVMRGGTLGWFGIIEQFAIVGFIAQLPFSFMLLRLHFELRWYMMSDRSLRVRHGILTVNEQTMTFANIQNISIRQNPLQRVFGISTVAVRAAGGGSQQASGKREGSSHEAVFEGVDNPEQIRTAILDRIRMHRDAGLGDPDEDASAPAAAPEAASAALRPAVTAANRILEEASALRQSLGAT